MITKNPIPNPLEENYFEKYYLKVKTPQQEKLVSRKNKQAAIEAYKHYKSLGWLTEWKGKWTGGKFEDTQLNIN